MDGVPAGVAVDRIRDSSGSDRSVAIAHRICALSLGPWNLRCPVPGDIDRSGRRLGAQLSGE